MSKSLIEVNAADFASGQIEVDLPFILNRIRHLANNLKNTIEKNIF